MFTRPRHLLVVGLGALLGLSAAGCQSSGRLASEPVSAPWTAQQPVPAPSQPVTQAAQLLPPRKAPAEDVQPLATTAAQSGPVVRAGGPLPDGSVVASSWRPRDRLMRPAVLPATVSRIERPATAEPPRVVPHTAEPPALPSPTRPQGEAVVMHQGPAQAVKDLATGHPPGPKYPHPHHVIPSVPGVPREGAKAALPPYVIEPPDILLVRFTRVPALPQPIDGQHLVRPDGTIYLGTYGSVPVAGLTLDQAIDAIASVLALKIRPLAEYLTYDDGTPYKIPGVSPEVKVQLADAAGNPKFIPLRDELYVDVLAYNSKVYYIVTDGGGYGEQVYRLPITGSETVLDALGQINGLPAVASKKKIWLARSNPIFKGGSHVLPIDWVGITQRGEQPTNYQLLPHDRIYVQSDALIRTDSRLAKFLAPIERTLGVTLLGSSVVNSISGRGRGFGGNN
jgi:polysaccharide export outer membrane protein